MSYCDLLIVTAGYTVDFSLELCEEDWFDEYTPLKREAGCSAYYAVQIGSLSM